MERSCATKVKVVMVVSVKREEKDRVTNMT
jgi:hypothetical protein